MNFDLEYIEQLVKMVSDSELSELTLEEGENAIVVRKEKTVVQAQTIMPQAVAAAPVAQTPASPAATEEKKEEAPKGKPITSPMVGTFYLASSPGAKPFVEVGQSVSVGQVVCIIEAMKLMNEIKSEQAGKIVQICVKNGDPIEFGQVLMYVE